MRTETSCISVLKVAFRPRVKLVNCKGALNPSPVVYTTDSSKVMVPVFLLSYWLIILVNSTRRFRISLALRFVLVFFIAITLLV